MCSDRVELTWLDYRSRVLIAAFRVLSAAPGTNELVYVCNMHLEGHPLLSLDRFRQLKSALDRVQQHLGFRPATKSKKAAAVALEDLNLNPGPGELF